VGRRVLLGRRARGRLSPDLGASPSPGGAGANGKRRTRTRTQQAANGRMSGRGVGPAVIGVWEERTIGDSWVGVEENVIEEEPEKEEGVDDVLLGGPLRRVVNGHVSVGDDEEGEEGFGEGGFNVLLADAILKRPGSIRVRSFSKKDKLADFGGVESEKGGSPTKNKHDATVVLEQEEELEQMTEFTFPSLADLGNVHYQSDGRKVNGDCAGVFRASAQAGRFSCRSVGCS
jgi:anthranilate synthase/indole-3-glycerol phosphate synthase/phosphoribosylanthranilate isomerase